MLTMLSQCGAPTTGVNVQSSIQDGPLENSTAQFAMSPKQPDQDEQFLQLFRSHMNIGEVPTPVPVVEETQPFVQQPTTFPNPPKPISYASAHYTHSRHVHHPTPQVRSEAEVVNALHAAGIDPTQLSHSQMSLLSTCPTVEFHQLMMASPQMEPLPTVAVPDLDAHEHDRQSNSTMDTEVDTDTGIVPPPRPLSSPGILYGGETEPYMAAGYASGSPNTGFCSFSRDKTRHGDRQMRLAAMDPVYIGSAAQDFARHGNAHQDMGDEMEM
jgi:hypothetical protein